MAVEKLILRSILYGADKIPDSWFEKLPGGYYKDAQGNTHKAGEKTNRKDKRTSKQEGRRAEYNDFYPERHASERGRQRQKDRSTSERSYDGGVDEDHYYYGGDGRPYRSKSRRRRRSVNGDRYGHRDGHQRGRHDDRERRPREVHGDDRHRDATSPTSRDLDYRRRRSAAYIDRPPNHSELRPSDVDPSTAAAKQSPSRKLPTQVPSQPTPPTSRNGNISNGYVPYAHIYGNSSPRNTSHSGSQQSSLHSGPGFEPRSRASPVDLPLQTYQQAPTAADIGAGSRNIPQDARNINEYGAETVNRYDGNGYALFERRPFSRQRGSPILDSYEADDNGRHSYRERGNNGTRSNSERHPDSRKSPRSQTPAPKSMFRDHSDVQRRPAYDRDGSSKRTTMRRAPDDPHYSD